jgi:hypothetical protein
MSELSGLRKICKAYGGLDVRGKDGKTVRYIWDYKKDEPVRLDAKGRPILCNDCKAKSADCAYGDLRDSQSCVDTRKRSM